MKVYELIQVLSKAPAGAEVVVCLDTTLEVPVDDASIDGDGVHLTGGNPSVIGPDSGHEIGNLVEAVEAFESMEVETE